MEGDSNWTWYNYALCCVKHIGCWDHVSVTIPCACTVRPCIINHPLYAPAAWKTNPSEVSKNKPDVEKHCGSIPSVSKVLNLEPVCGLQVTLLFHCLTDTPLYSWSTPRLLFELANQWVGKLMRETRFDKMSKLLIIMCYDNNKICLFMRPPWDPSQPVSARSIRLLLFYYLLVSVVWLFCGTINRHPTMHRAQVAVLLGSSWFKKISTTWTTSDYSLQEDSYMDPVRIQGITNNNWTSITK